MDTLRDLPLYFQDFEDLRRKNYFYVDKTQYLAQLVTRYKDFFLSRPHRFGKSLFLSTLRAYFEGKKSCLRGSISTKQKRRSHADRTESRGKFPQYFTLILMQRIIIPPKRCLLCSSNN